MTEITTRSDMGIEYVQHMGDDRTIARAAKVSTGQDVGDDDHIDGLIRYLIRERHTSTLEHNVLTIKAEVPIFVAREWMRHRTQCISGDTKITFSSGKPQGKAGSIGMRHKTIAEHYEHFHEGVLDTMGRRRVLPSVRNAKVLSLNEETGERYYSTVLDVVKSGVKKTYTMTTLSGRSVRATRDHKFLTSQGWKVLGDIEVGESLIINHRTYETDPESRKVPWSLRVAINTWTASVKPEVFERDGGVCQSCLVEISSVPEARCDHIVPVVVDLEKALSKSNLQTLCQRCDRGKTEAEQSLATRDFEGKIRFTSPDPVVSITEYGDEETYDLVLDDPHHNFFGNGVVTHNSYNEISGRYAKLEPVFYLPSDERPLVNAGSGAHPKLVHGSDDQARAIEDMEIAYEESWSRYELMIERGIATEVARNVLPVAVYTKFYATANLNNWFKFLTLRNGDEGHPQYEIVEAAQKVEAIIADLWPIAYNAWKTNGERK